MNRFWNQRRLSPDSPDIWLGIDQETSEKVIMKMTERENAMDSERNFRIRQEAEMHKELSETCPEHVIEFRAFFVNDENHFVHVMERADLTLADHIMKSPMHLIPEDTAKCIARSLFTAIAAIHNVGICHRDIKPANIFLLRNTQSAGGQIDVDHGVKLGDFGIATRENGYSNLSGVKGTRGYMAPEVLAGKNYGKLVDVWSAGAVVYEMLYAKLPFGGQEKKLLGGSRTSGRLSLETNGSGFRVSEDAKDFIAKVLCENPENRPTAEQALCHPWILSAPRPSVPQQHSVTVIPQPCVGFDGWIQLTQPETGTIYFFNEKTGVTQWHHPSVMLQANADSTTSSSFHTPLQESPVSATAIIAPGTSVISPVQYNTEQQQSRQSNTSTLLSSPPTPRDVSRSPSPRRVRFGGDDDVSAQTAVAAVGNVAKAAVAFREGIMKPSAAYPMSSTPSSPAGAQQPNGHQPVIYTGSPAHNQVHGFSQPLPYMGSPVYKNGHSTPQPLPYAAPVQQTFVQQASNAVSPADHSSPTAAVRHPAVVQAKQTESPLQSPVKDSDTEFPPKVPEKVEHDEHATNPSAVMWSQTAPSVSVKQVAASFGNETRAQSLPTEDTVSQKPPLPAREKKPPLLANGVKSMDVVTPIAHCDDQPLARPANEETRDATTQTTLSLIASLASIAATALSVNATVSADDSDPFEAVVPSHPDWRVVRLANGSVYYYNVETRESAWSLPASSPYGTRDEADSKAVQAPPAPPPSTPATQVKPGAGQEHHAMQSISMTDSLASMLKRGMDSTAFAVSSVLASMNTHTPASAATAKTAGAPSDAVQSAATKASSTRKSSLTPATTTAASSPSSSPRSPRNSSVTRAATTGAAVRSPSKTRTVARSGPQSPSAAGGNGSSSTSPRVSSKLRSDVPPPPPPRTRNGVPPGSGGKSASSPNISGAGSPASGSLTRDVKSAGSSPATVRRGATASSKPDVPPKTPVRK